MNSFVSRSKADQGRRLLDQLNAAARPHKIVAYDLASRPDRSATVTVRVSSSGCIVIDDPPALDPAALRAARRAFSRAVGRAPNSILMGRRVLLKLARRHMSKRRFRRYRARLRAQERAWRREAARALP